MKTEKGGEIAVRENASLPARESWALVWGMRTALLLLTCLASLPLVAQQTWQYPASTRGTTVDTYHGTQVADPYRWLEDLDSLETQSWVAAQNQLTMPFLSKLPAREKLKARLTELWNFERYGLPTKEGGRYFYSKNSGLQNQSVLYVQEKLKAESRVLIDPNTLSKDGTVALTTLEFSPDGKLVLYGVAAAGSDWNEFRVREVDSGKDLPDKLVWIKFSGASWTKDGKGFFYSRYPAPKQDSGNAKTFAALEHQKLYYHRLGTPQSEDILIYEMPEQPKWFVGGGTTDDGRYLIVHISRGSSDENILSYVDLGDPLKPDLKAPVKPLISEWKAQHSVVGNVGSRFILKTTLGAARSRVVAIDLASPAESSWTTLIPENADTLETVMVAGGKLLVRYMHHAANTLQLFSLEGKELGSIPLPGLGTVSGISGKPEDDELFFSFTSYTRPQTNYRYDLKTGKTELLQFPTLKFNPDDYETVQAFYTSKDGTKVPMFITKKKGMKTSANTPALLYAYGGFNISMKPGFSVQAMVWLEQGGIYVVPNLRGGGEYGREWHEAGTKERKQNVFDDFIAAAEYLFAQNYSSPSKLVLSGGSNGGLLVGAVVNQRPDLCRVAWPAVGVMDMLRFHKFTIGYAWISDYGSSDTAEGFKYLRAYSPLHTVKEGAKYPAVLVTTADHDDRVHPAHSFKYTSALQAGAYNGPGALPVMVRIETKAGHGAGKPTSKQIDEAADKLAFAVHFLGMDESK